MHTNSLLQIHAKSLKIYIIYAATSALLSIFRISDTMRFWFRVIFVIQSFIRSTSTEIKFDQDRERHLLAVREQGREKFFSSKREEVIGGDRENRNCSFS
jgi:hypothetical protein